MKCQILSSGKNKKNISKCCLLPFLPSMLSVKVLSKIAAVDILFFFFLNFSAKIRHGISCEFSASVIFSEK